MSKIPHALKFNCSTLKLKLNSQNVPNKTSPQNYSKQLPWGFVYMESSIHVVIVQNGAFVQPLEVHLDNVTLKHDESNFIIHCTVEYSGEK